MDACYSVSNVFFGRYLVQKGVIDDQALAQALRFQDEANKRIGALAVEKGLIDAAAAERIFEEQKLVDEPFGSIALRRGLISRRQLNDLLFAQTVHTTHLGEALLMQGHITPKQFALELGEFLSLEKRRHEMIQHVLEGYGGEGVVLSAIEALQKGLMRFAGEEAKIDSVSEDPEPCDYAQRFDLHAMLARAGWVACSVFLPEQLLERIAATVGGNGMDHDDEWLQTRSREFMDVVGRYFVQALECAGHRVSESRAEHGHDDDAPLPALQGGTLVLATTAGMVALRVHAERALDATV